MNHPSTHTRAYAGLIASLSWLAIVACAEPPAPSDPTVALAPEIVRPVLSVGDQLGHLRGAVAGFHNINKALNAGYSQLTDCMVDPNLGGMGFHYAKSDAFDGVIDPTAPKALLYEPESNGKLRLVAVEFIVPYSIAPRDGPAPRVFDQDFVHNDDFQIWMLHAWIFKNNPSGIFATWNPNVNCDAVAASQRMSHGHN
jgi:hypothetical protein